MRDAFCDGTLLVLEGGASAASTQRSSMEQRLALLEAHVLSSHASDAHTAVTGATITASAGPLLPMHYRYTTHGMASPSHTYPPQAAPADLNPAPAGHYHQRPLDQTHSPRHVYTKAVDPARFLNKGMPPHAHVRTAGTLVGHDSYGLVGSADTSPRAGTAGTRVGYALVGSADTSQSTRSFLAQQAQQTAPPATHYASSTTNVHLPQPLYTTDSLLREGGQGFPLPSTTTTAQHMPASPATPRLDTLTAARRVLEARAYTGVSAGASTFTVGATAQAPPYDTRFSTAESMLKNLDPKPFTVNFFDVFDVNCICPYERVYVGG